MYKIDYGTGVVQTVEGDLEAAKKAAVEGMSYTQENVKIFDEDDNLVAISRWYGVQPEEDDEVLADFGEYGFYGEWTEE